MDKKEKKWWKVADAIDYLGITKNSIYKLTKNKELTHYKVGKHLYFTKEDIDNWVSRFRVASGYDLASVAARMKP